MFLDLSKFLEGVIFILITQCALIECLLSARGHRDEVDTLPAPGGVPNLL